MEAETEFNKNYAEAVNYPALLMLSVRDVQQATRTGMGTIAAILCLEMVLTPEIRNFITADLNKLLEEHTNSKDKDRDAILVLKKLRVIIAALDHFNLLLKQPRGVDKGSISLIDESEE